MERRPGILITPRLCCGAQLPLAKKTVQIGMRGLANDPDAIGNARKMVTQIITAEELHRCGVAWVHSQIEPAENVYVSFDVDSMDPTLAPGTGTLEPGGLNFAEIDDLTMAPRPRAKLVGLDIMEVNPLRDSSGWTAQTAIQLMVDMLGSAFR